MGASSGIVELVGRVVREPLSQRVFVMRSVVRVSICLGALVALPRAAHAATYRVCPSGCTYTTINAAVSNASTVNGDTISVHAGTFTESVNVTKNLTIIGAGASATIVQANTTYGSGTGGSVFKIGVGVTATIKNLTARHGANPTYGGGVDNQGTGTLDGLIIERNMGQNGSGIGNRSTGVLTVKKTLIRNNVGASSGAGIFNAGILTLEDSTVSGNSGTGGGIYAISPSVTNLSRSLVSANGNIGAYISNSTLNAVNSTFTGNYGSGLLVANGTLRLSSCTVTGNFAEGAAGGIEFNNTVNIVQIKNTILSGNLGSGVPHDCGGSHRVLRWTPHRNAQGLPAQRLRQR